MLTGQALQWATANAKDSTQRMYQNANGDPTNPVPTLPGHARHWATPNTAMLGNEKCRENRTGTGEQLMDEVANWPTARQEDSERAGNHPEATDSLTGVTNNWPTPQFAGKGPQTGPSRGTTGQESTASAAEKFSLPAEPITDDGLNSLLEVWTRPTCPRLSPAFQFWLMGWPHPQTFYGSEETESCHCAPPTHSCTCSRRLWSQWRRKNLSALCSLLICE
jgi:hypothetical protein